MRERPTPEEIAGDVILGVKDEIPWQPTPLIANYVRSPSSPPPGSIERAEAVARLIADDKECDEANRAAARGAARLVISALAEHGYVVVHSDNVREREERIVRVAWEESWDDHRWRGDFEPAQDVDVRYVLEQVEKGHAASS